MAHLHSFGIPISKMSLAGARESETESGGGSTEVLVGGGSICPCRLSKAEAPAKCTANTWRVFFQSKRIE